MSAETALKIRRFEPRSYQREIIWQIEENNCKKALLIFPRRSGKDIVAFNIGIRRAITSPSTVFYIFPTFTSARRIIWDAIDNEGHRILDWYCPDEIVSKKNSSEMKIEFRNGSILRLVGSNNYDSLVGSNFQGAIFSEYALQDPNAYLYLSPIMVANGAFCLMCSTPRGHNHMYELYERARNSKDWYVSHLTLHDTQHIPFSEIERLRQEGIMSEDLIQQEYFCSFELGIEGSYYGKIIDKMRTDNRITTVAHDPSFRVHTVWDLGVSDMTSIVFVQVCGNVIRIIDYYENSNKGLDHYAAVVQSKGYSYDKHIAPHDIQVREWAGGAMTRLDKARQLGIKFIVAPKVPIADGIEAVKTMLARTWIDENNCRELIKALENYRREYDPLRKVYQNHPFHDWSSHCADAIRYLAVSLKKLSPSLTAEELDQRYAQAIGSQGGIPRPFRNEP